MTRLSMGDLLERARERRRGEESEAQRVERQARDSIAKNVRKGLELLPDELDADDLTRVDQNGPAIAGLYAFSIDAREFLVGAYSAAHAAPTVFLPDLFLALRVGDWLPGASDVSWWPPTDAPRREWAPRGYARITRLSDVAKALDGEQ